MSAAVGKRDLLVLVASNGIACTTLAGRCIRKQWRSVAEGREIGECPWFLVMRKAIVVLVVVTVCGMLNLIEWHFGGEGTRGFPFAWVTYMYAYDAKTNGDILVDVAYHPLLGLVDVLVVVAVARWVGGIGVEVQAGGTGREAKDER